ncbi:MAG: HEAT repeat domain-containing protein [Phycisphaerales bacterium]
MTATTRAALLLPLLAAALGACAFNTRPGATSILEAFDTRRTPLELAAMAEDEYDANNRYLGTLGLAGLPFAGEPLYIWRFETNARDTDPAVRIAALRGLAAHGDPSHVPTLLAALADKDPLVRQEAARGLQRLHSEAAIDPLMLAMREPDPRRPSPRQETEPAVRAQAAHALGQYAQRRVLQGLIAGLGDADLAVNRASLASLRTLTGQDLGLDHGAWIVWLDQSSDPFAGRSVYYYPVFSREPRLYELLPFIPGPPNEVAAPPAGYPLQ